MPEYINSSDEHPKAVPVMNDGAAFVCLEAFLVLLVVNFFFEEDLAGYVASANAIPPTTPSHADPSGPWPNPNIRATKCKVALNIPSEILLKRSKFNPEEFALMKTHPAISVRMLADSVSKHLRMAGNIAVAHPERWDGAG